MTKTLPRVASLVVHSALFSSVAAAQSFTVVLPAAASLHGLPPAFFHSDVAIFNRSAVRTAVVRATYRCATGACDNSPRVFGIGPRELVVQEDIVATLFDAPETSGAIEFSSTEPIVVTSRLYSPSRPAPTLGMFVPGLGPDRAFPTSNLVNLSHSQDPSVGFRTNIGVFNPSDQTQTVNIRCIEPRIGNLGGTNQVVGPHQLLQINDGDLFREFRVLRTVSTFSCFVSGGGPSLPLYTWAAVIDNQSNDATFITGQQFFAPPRILALPAASLHGAAGTFYRSDLAVFNDDVIGNARVTAIYRCFLDACAVTPTTFDVSLGATLVFSDVVATLFGAPETAGWIEFLYTGRITVTSRLHTPGPLQGTVGMSVPGLEPRDGTTSQVLPLISKGSRVNVGVINPDGAAQVITIRLFTHAGQLLGTATRLLLQRQATQINDIFREFGVPGDVDAAYILVEGNAPFRIFSYAAIIDNASQDPIFVTGQDDPESPPID